MLPQLVFLPHNTEGRCNHSPLFFFFISPDKENWGFPELRALSTEAVASSDLEFRHILSYAHAGS